MRKSVVYLIAVLLSYSAIYWLKLERVMTMENVSEMYGEMAKGGMAEAIYRQAHDYWAVGLLLTVIPTFLKVLFWSLTIYVGFYLVSKQSFVTIFGAVVVAESVNVVMNAVQVLNLAYFSPPTSIAELTVLPLSLANLFDISKLEQWMLIPLSAANLFEVFYVALLGAVLKRGSERQASVIVKVLMSSYVLVSVLVVVISTFVAVYVTR